MFDARQAVSAPAPIPRTPSLRPTVPPSPGSQTRPHAMQSLPFDKAGRFYRGSLHVHYNRSDGTLPPAAVVQIYRDQGYDFLAITDHFQERYDFPITDTRAFRTPGFTTLLGAELTAPAKQGGPELDI